MSTIQVKDGAGTTQTVAKVPTTGEGNPAADSMPVVQPADAGAYRVADAASKGTLDAISAKLPATLGSKPGAASLSVALSTEAQAQLGDVAEAAPGTDTASSGINGRLQRIAQRLTGLIALLPASLGIKAASASLSTVAAQGVLVSRSGTIAAGGTAQQIMAANGARVGFSVLNLSAGDLWIHELGTAAAAQPSLRLVAGAYFETPVGYGSTGAVSIFGATTGQAFSSREW